MTEGQCTEVLIHHIVTDEICAFNSLLHHEQNDATVGLYFLDSLPYEGINIIYDLNQAKDGIIMVNLS